MASEKEKLENELLSEIKKLVNNSGGARKTIGLIEDVWIKGSKKEKKVRAKVDTGAQKSSISKELFEEIGKTPKIKDVVVQSAMKKEAREVVNLLIKTSSTNYVKSSFTVAERHNMQYPMLIGRNTLLKLNVEIDPAKQVKRDLKGKG